MHKNALFLLKNYKNRPALCPRLQPSVAGGPSRPPMAWELFPKKPPLLRNPGYVNASTDMTETVDIGGNAN